MTLVLKTKIHLKNKKIRMNIIITNITEFIETQKKYMIINWLKQQP